MFLTMKIPLYQVELIMNRWLSRRLCLLSFLIAVNVFSTSGLEEKHVCGFDGDDIWRMTRRAPYRVSDIDVTLCTHILFYKAQITLKSEDRIKVEVVERPARSALNKLRRIKVPKKLIGIQIPSAILSKPALYDKVAEGISGMARYLQGVCLIWHSENTQEEQKFVKFAQILHEMLNAKNIKLVLQTKSSTLPSNQTSLPNILDFIMLETHGDCSSQGSGIVTHSQVIQEVRKWTDAGVPKDKLVISMATFGCYTAAKNPVNSNYRTSGRNWHIPEYHLSYSDICEKLNTTSNVSRQPSSKEPSLQLNDTTYIIYEDEISLGIKLSWLREEGYGGWLVQKPNLDDHQGEKCGESYPLLRTLNEPKVHSITPITVGNRSKTQPSAPSGRVAQPSSSTTPQHDLSSTTSTKSTLKTQTTPKSSTPLTVTSTIPTKAESSTQTQNLITTTQSTPSTTTDNISTSTSTDRSTSTSTLTQTTTTTATSTTAKSAKSRERSATLSTTKERGLTKPTKQPRTTPTTTQSTTVTTTTEAVKTRRPQPTSSPTQAKRGRQATETTLSQSTTTIQDLSGGPCTLGRYTVDPQDGGRFYQCGPAGWVLKMCQPGLVFNPTYNVCVRNRGNKR